MSYSKEPQIISLLEPADYQAGATDMDSVHMGKLNRLKIVIQFGAITGEDPVFKLYAGATAGTKTTELPFKYRATAVDWKTTAADVFGARTAVAIGGTGLTLNPVASYDHRMVEIDILSDELPDGKPWLTVETDDGSASVLLMSALGIGFPRFSGDSHTTAV